MDRPEIIVVDIDKKNTFQNEASVYVTDNLDDELAKRKITYCLAMLIISGFILFYLLR